MLSGSVVKTSMIPILIGISGFVASFFVPLFTRKIPLNNILWYTQGGKTLLIGILVLLFNKIGALSVLLIYDFVVLTYLWDGFAAPVSYAILPRHANDLGKANAAFSVSSESIQLIAGG